MLQKQGFFSTLFLYRTQVISIGVAIGATSWMALLEKADRALFQAKEQGKNKVAS